MQDELEEIEEPNLGDHYTGTYQADNGSIHVLPSTEEGMLIVVQDVKDKGISFREVEAHQVIMPVDYVERQVNVPCEPASVFISEELFSSELKAPAI